MLRTQSCGFPIASVFLFSYRVEPGRSGCVRNTEQPRRFAVDGNILPVASSFSSVTLNNLGFRVNSVSAICQTPDTHWVDVGN